jgi:hypothetical protein
MTENFEKGMIYMKILKKGGGSREKGGWGNEIHALVIHIFYNKIIIYTGISLLILASLLWMFLIFFRLGNHMNLLLIKIKHARWVWTKGVIRMCKSKKNRKHNGQKNIVEK